MEQQLIELHFAQLEKAWKKIKPQSFHDKRLQEHVAFLDQLYERIKLDVGKGIEESEIDIYKHFIDFAFRNIEFIDSSTLNLIPYEIIKCLESVLKEWLPNFENYIIVTALRQNISSYSINLTTFEKLYRAIEEKFEIVFPYRLIQLNIPKFLSRDYLTNVVLYHEIGHFVDSYYKISDTIARNIVANKPADYDVFTQFLPALLEVGKLSSRDIVEIVKRHLMEYFADLFAAQYIGDTSVHYLSYIAKNDPFTYTHPATLIRFEVVYNFIEKKENNLILEVQQALSSIVKMKFKFRYSQLLPNDFLNLIPIEVKDDFELHSLFVLGWQIWLNKRNDIHAQNAIEYELEPNKLYIIINSLIEKSIGNYIVKESWSKAVASYDSK